jgi:lysylphosphatidylglycerol synthetase-like protein (DUF2156 family)
VVRAVQHHQVDDVPVSGIARRVRRRVYRRGANGYNYRSLAAFKQKFGVCWESRMIAVEVASWRCRW